RKRALITIIGARPERELGRLTGSRKQALTDGLLALRDTWALCAVVIGLITHWANSGGLLPRLMIFGNSSMGTWAEQRLSLQSQAMPVSINPLPGLPLSISRTLPRWTLLASTRIRRGSPVVQATSACSEPLAKRSR